jgi:hypothetical protein
MLASLTEGRYVNSNGITQEQANPLGTNMSVTRMDTQTNSLTQTHIHFDTWLAGTVNASILSSPGGPTVVAELDGQKANFALPATGTVALTSGTQVTWKQVGNTSNTDLQLTFQRSTASQTVSGSTPTRGSFIAAPLSQPDLRELIVALSKKAVAPAA